MSLSAAYPVTGPTAIGLDRSVALASRSRFFARKLAAAGVSAGRPLDWDTWLEIPPTTKDELRAIGSAEEELWIVPREEVSEFWRSGGVTGRPLFYPRTAGDVEESLVAFARCVRFAGVTPRDVFMCSLPIGIHPAGQQIVRAAERLGAATLWAGAGNQTPSAAQVDLVHDLGVTVWCGMASFGLHLAHLAEAAGRPFPDSRVHTVITTAEMLSPAKRALLAKLWSARVVDVFGMSELALMGVECGCRPGLHIWSQHFFCEVLDTETLRPVEEGEVGVLCNTPITGNTAIPFLRWLSGDVVRLEHGCECEAAAHPRIVHSGRTLSFVKVKGVNLNQAEVEDALYATPQVVDFRVTVTPEERLVVEIESAAGAEKEAESNVDSLFQNRFGVRAEVSLLGRGTIARALEGELKAQRFVDRRPAG